MILQKDLAFRLRIQYNLLQYDAAEDGENETE